MSIKERIAQLQRQQVEQQKSPTKEVQVNRLGEDRLMLKSNATNNHQGIQTDPNALDEERLRLLRVEYESYLRQVGKLDSTLSFEEWQTKQREVGRLQLQHTHSETDSMPTKRHRRELSASVGDENQRLPHSTVIIAGAQAPSIIPTYSDKPSETTSTISTSPTSSSSSAKADLTITPHVSIAERVRRLSAHALTPTSTSPSSASVSTSAAMAGDVVPPNVSTIAPARANADVIASTVGVSGSVAARAALFAQQSHSNGSFTQNDTSSAKVIEGESTDGQQVEGEMQPDVKTKAKLVSSRLSVGNAFFTPVKTDNNDNSSTVSATPQKLQFSEKLDNVEQETSQKTKPGRLSVDRLAVLAGGSGMYSPGNNRRESGISTLPGQMPFPGSPNQGLTVKQIRAMRMSLGGNQNGNVSSGSEQIADERNSDAVETKAVAGEAEAAITSGDAGVVMAEAGVVSPTLRKPRMRVDRRVSTRVSFSSLEDASAHIDGHTETPVDNQTRPRVATEAETLTQISVGVPTEATEAPEATVVTSADAGVGDGDGPIAITTNDGDVAARGEAAAEAEAEVEIEAEVDAGVTEMDVSREACVAANADEEVDVGEHHGFLSTLSLHASTHTNTHTTHTTASSDSLSSFSPSLRSGNFPFGSPLPTPTPLPLFHTHTVPPPITSEAIPLVIPSLSPCHGERELEWVEEGEEGGERGEGADVEVEDVVTAGAGAGGEGEGEVGQRWITPIDVNIHAETETEVEMEAESEVEAEARRLAKERELLRLAEKSVREWASVRGSRVEDGEGRGVRSQRQRLTQAQSQTPDKRNEETMGSSDGDSWASTGVGNGNEGGVVADVNANMLQSLLMDDDDSYVYNDNGPQEPSSTVNLASAQDSFLSASFLDFSTTPSSTTSASIQRTHKDVKFARVTGASAFHTETPTSLSQHTDSNRRGAALAHPHTLAHQPHKTTQSELQPSSLAQASMASTQALPHESAVPFDADIDRDHADFARVVNARLILDSVPQVNKATLRAAAAMHQRLSQTPQKDAIQVRILATRSVADKQDNDTNTSTPQVPSMALKVEDVAFVPSQEENAVEPLASVLGAEQKVPTRVSDASPDGGWMDKVRSWWPWVLAAGAAVVATRVYITRNNVNK